MCIAYCADVANQETILDLQLLAHFQGCRVEAKEIGLDSIFDNKNPFGGNTPIAHEVVFEGGRHDDDASGVAIEKAGDCAQGAMEQGSFGARANSRE